MRIGQLKKVMAEFSDDTELTFVRDTIYFGSGPLVVGVMNTTTCELIKGIGLRDDGNVSPDNDTRASGH